MPEYFLAHRPPRPDEGEGDAAVRRAPRMAGVRPSDPVGGELRIVRTTAVTALGF
ncbi:MAG: hypothetical protein AVDCRST_MAG19-222 [uncultured Thermomicrobiales bacterium]|uniref:Uncharacterized protein n=1 Tax=uncultured Thermomicrobiales bacterium TaxID=1645740 RepID=A0A6J4UB82_9BACT|nr:MAG: hypothetical protein AVDCRST_MAG19-222 [uncultured Thermomicrobiales bacterium]